MLLPMLKLIFFGFLILNFFVVGTHISFFIKNFSINFLDRRFLFKVWMLKTSKVHAGLVQKGVRLTIDILCLPVHRSGRNDIHTSLQGVITYYS